MRKLNLYHFNNAKTNCKYFYDFEAAITHFRPVAVTEYQQRRRARGSIRDVRQTVMKD